MAAAAAAAAHRTVSSDLRVNSTNSAAGFLSPIRRDRLQFDQASRRRLPNEARRAELEGRVKKEPHGKDALGIRYQRASVVFSCKDVDVIKDTRVDAQQQICIDDQAIRVLGLSRRSALNDRAALGAAAVAVGQSSRHAWSGDSSQVTDAPAMYGTYSLIQSIELGRIVQILETEKDSRIAIECSPPLWDYCVFTFPNTDDCEDFLGWVLKQHRKMSGDEGRLPIATTALDSLETVFSAKRALSRARLRLALDSMRKQGRLKGAVERTEDDKLNMAGNPHVAELIRSRGDAMISLSMEVEVLKSSSSAKPESSPAGYPHILMVTESSIFLFQRAEDRLRFARHVCVTDIEFVVEEQRPTGGHIIFVHLKCPERWKDLGTIRTILSGKVDRKFEVILRIGADIWQRNAEGDRQALAAAAVAKLRDHLRRVYLEERIERLPWKVESDFSSKKRTSWSIVGGVVEKVVAGSALAAKLRQDGKVKKYQGQGSSLTGRSAASSTSGALTWLLWITQNKLFDLIFTFSSLTTSQSYTLRHGGLSPLEGPDALIGRRLGLSLLALCDKNGRTLQLIKEALMYEIEMGRQDTGALFQRDSFAARVLALFVGHSSAQYIRLVLSEPVSIVLEDRAREALSAPPGGRRAADQESKDAYREQFRDHCSLFLSSIAKKEHVDAMPYELRMIVSMIHTCCGSINEVHAEDPDHEALQPNHCVGAYLAQRLWFPAVAAPDAFGLSDGASKEDVAYLISVAKVLLAALSGGGCIPPELLDAQRDIGSMRQWVDSKQGLVNAHLGATFDRGMVENLDASSDSEDDDRGFGESRFGTSMRRNSGTIGKEEQTVPTTSTRFNKIREGVLKVQAGEVGTLSRHLQSLHDALAKDTERLLVHLWSTKRRLLNDILDLEKPPRVRDFVSTPHTAPSSPESAPPAGSPSAFEPDWCAPTLVCTVAGAVAAAGLPRESLRPQLRPSDLVLGIPVVASEGGGRGRVIDVGTNGVRVKFNTGEVVLYDAWALWGGQLRKGLSREEEVYWLERRLAPLQREVAAARGRITAMRAEVKRNAKLLTKVPPPRAEAEPDPEEHLSGTIPRPPTAYMLPRSASPPRRVPSAPPVPPESDSDATSDSSDDLWHVACAASEVFAPSPKCRFCPSQTRYSVRRVDRSPPSLPPPDSAAASPYHLRVVDIPDSSSSSLYDDDLSDDDLLLPDPRPAPAS
eukprot:TRINITY_DN16460_c0_g1_i1.p1 TRINITY_DN16460_c0_g1~~TRINITY_DN16460_c0_g1_i1.p1  ORF type:complete len:1223 (+),score=256.36 TRINITY_DN16460_c0_g1_i1:56-3670(+)